MLSSSSAVYGAPASPFPLPETAPLHPVNDYGRSKAAMERICAPWRVRGLEICALRIGNVVGADMLLLNAQKAPEQGLFLDQFSDSQGPLRSYIGPANLAQVTQSLAGFPDTLPEELNIGAAQPIAINDLLQAAGFSWHWQAGLPTALQRITLDVTQLSALYPFCAEDSDPHSMIQQWLYLKDPVREPNDPQ